MEKQKQTPAPLEVEMPRPELRMVMFWCAEHRTTTLTDGIWLVKGNGKVVVREAQNLPGDTLTPNKLGTYSDGRPRGPAYTGPIDDELMANILAYG